MDFYTRFLASLNERHVEYIVIGMFGIAYYAQDAGDLVSTQDCDVFVRPVPKNFAAALQAAVDSGAWLEVNGETLLLHPDDVPVILERRCTVQARTDRGETIDLVSKISLPWATMARGTRTFT